MAEIAKNQDRSTLNCLLGLASLAARPTNGIDGSKALRAAIEDVFGSLVWVPRSHRHDAKRA